MNPRRIPWYLLVLSVALVCVMTYPLPFVVTTHIPGFYSTDEPFGALWHFWWLDYAFEQKVSPLTHQMIAAPTGIVNAQGGFPLWNFINTRLSVLMGNVAAYSVQVLFSFFASLLCMYFLARAVTRSRLAAFFSALVFAFCPYHFARSWQHLGLAQIQWMPMYLLALLWAREKPGIRPLLLAVLAIFLNISFELHYAYFMFIATAVFVSYALICSRPFNRSQLRFVGNVSLVLIAGALFLLPALLKIDLRQIISGQRQLQQPAVWSLVRPFEDLFAQSARPLSYFLPAPSHPLFGRLAESFVGTSLYGESLTEHVLYLGWIPLVLAFIAVKKWRLMRRRGEAGFYIGFFVVLAVTAWLFSQPPWWQFGPVKIYMPSFFMYKLLPMFRAYCRFGILVSLSIAVLAGIGFGVVLKRFRTQRARFAAAALLCAGVLFEFWSYPPYKVIDVSRVPAVYTWLAAQPGDLTIAEYPLDIEGPNEMYKYFQTEHHKKIINGTTPGTQAHAFIIR